MDNGAARETQRYRTAVGGQIDRSRLVSFTFDGQTLTGHPGDTLASALLANGIHLVGRSFKYHRPRGILAAGSEEPNALVTVRRGWRRTTPNIRATEVEIYDGLMAESQNRWPSLARDVGSVNDRIAPFLPAGFYYKTFMGLRANKGSRAWVRYFEPAIRRMAGLGRAPQGSDPDHYARIHAHCDVLVVGMGPAGLMAALAASETGARVIIADEQALPGGSLIGETKPRIGGRAVADWLADTIGVLEQRDNVRLLRRTTVFGSYPDRMMGMVQRLSDHLAEPPPGLPRERLWQVRAHAIVLATGAIERPQVFPGNDRPGIMLAHAALTYLDRFGVLAGTQAVLLTDNDEAYRALPELKASGAQIARVVDLRETPGTAARQLAAEAGAVIVAGGSVCRTSGRARIESVTITHASGHDEQIEANLLLMSAGFTPTLHLFSQLGGRLAWDNGVGAMVPASEVAHVWLAGAASGERGLAASLAGGLAAGRNAARDACPVTLEQGAATEPVSAPEVTGVVDLAGDGGEREIAMTRLVNPGRAFVDFQNDVTAKDLGLATREGFRSVEHVKRYTTTG
ncbi:MAG: 2Fe-2S iron-sulfur cluster-binding protein, partial [Hyphomicrobiaceae bacterium]